MGNDKNEQRKLRRPKAPEERAQGSAYEMLRDIDPNAIQTAVLSAIQAGGAIRIGATRDGGALNVGVYWGTEYFTDYLRPSEDVETYFRDLAHSFDDAGKLDMQPKAARKPK